MNQAEQPLNDSDSMHDLRIQIWDYLFRLGGSQPIAIIAEQMGTTPQGIQQAVDHPWFRHSDGLVSIART